MKVALITAIIGGIDEPKTIPAQVVKPGVELYPVLYTKPYFTYIPDGLADRTQALYFKTQMHTYLPGYDLYLWTDGKVQIKRKDFVQQCIDALGDGEIAIMKHLYRDCIYKEVDHIEHCIKHGNEYLATRYAHRPLRKQVEQYRQLGYPENNGLNDCCIFIVRNSALMARVFDNWWYHCKEDMFDQVSIQVLCWANSVQIKPIVFRPGSFINVPHIKLK